MSRLLRRSTATGELSVEEFSTGFATLVDEVGRTGWTTEPLTGAVLFGSREEAEAALREIEGAA